MLLRSSLGAGGLIRIQSLIRIHGSGAIQASWRKQASSRPSRDGPPSTDAFQAFDTKPEQGWFALGLPSQCRNVLAAGFPVAYSSVGLGQSYAQPSRAMITSAPGVIRRSFRIASVLSMVPAFTRATSLEVFLRRVRKRRISRTRSIPEGIGRFLGSLAEEEDIFEHCPHFQGFCEGEQKQVAKRASYDGRPRPSIKVFKTTAGGYSTDVDVHRTGR